MENKQKHSKKDVEKLVAPFVRVSPPWDVYEVLKTVVTSLFLLPIRLILFPIFMLFLWFCAQLVLFRVPKSKREEFAFQNLTKFQSVMVSIIFKLVRAGIFLCFGIIKIKCSPKKLTTNRYTIIANHVGYLDILVLMCAYKTSFIAKGGLEFYPIVGTVGSAIQCLYIRPNDNVIDKLTNRMKMRYNDFTEETSDTCIRNLIAFPEGTTTNGTSIMAFRTGLFAPGLPLQPVCITFPHKHWNPSWETVDFKYHLFRTMTQFVNHVTIEELPLYTPSIEEQNDRRLYAANVQDVFSKALNVPQYRVNKKQKFVYHDYIRKTIKEDELFSKCKEISVNDIQLQYLASRGQQEV